MAYLIPFLLTLLSPLFLISCVRRPLYRDDSETKEATVQVGKAAVRLLEAGPPRGPTVLLLHGGRFTKETWERLGTPIFLARKGYRVLALDLPGYGASEKGTLPRDRFLERFLASLSLKEVALVSPSMSGSFSLPFVAEHPDSLWAYVPVAPVGIQRYSKDLEGSPVPCLVVWGEKDRVFPVGGADRLARLFAHASVRILPGASHPCYLDRPKEFHEALFAFLRKHHPGN